MTFTPNPDIYTRYDFITNINEINSVANNRLFATFTTLEDLDNLLNNITTKYTVMYNKVFVLHVKSNGEYVVTYNVEYGNVNDIINNTILVHRKKISNTLYSLNALNELIKSLNGGVVDKKYEVNWNNYKNSILLTQNGELKNLKTKIYKILEV